MNHTKVTTGKTSEAKKNETNLEVQYLGGEKTIFGSISIKVCVKIIFYIK